MADILTEAGTALYGRLSGGTALAAAAPGGVWNEVVATGPTNLLPTRPYLVYAWVSGDDASMVGSTLVEANVDVKVIDDDDYPDRAGSAEAEVFALLNNKPLTLGGFTNTGIYRVNLIRLQNADGWWNVVGTYRIRLQAT